MYCIKASFLVTYFQTLHTENKYFLWIMITQHFGFDPVFYVAS